MKDLMTAPVIILAPDDSLDLADEIMSLGRVRQLPVLSGRALVGILTQCDILRAPRLLAPVLGLAVDTRAALSALRVGDVMASTLITIGADASLQDAAEHLLKHQVGCLPILEGGTLVGMSPLLTCCAPLPVPHARFATEERGPSAQRCP